MISYTSSDGSYSSSSRGERGARANGCATTAQSRALDLVLKTMALAAGPIRNVAFSR